MQQKKMRTTPLTLTGKSVREFVKDLNSESRVSLNKNDIELFQTAKKIVDKSK